MCAAVVVLLIGSFPLACAQPREVILASTTSTLDSGLFDVLLPAFEEQHDGVKVKVIAVGSGEAIALGRHGDADVLLVHSPPDELAFMAAGFGERRLPVMANDFVLAGPPEDPAQIRGERDVTAALRRLAAAGAAFVSRGDSSGTHRRELVLWNEAGVTTDTRSDVGQGMGEALMIASERGAYLLTDRGTFLALSPNLQLEILVQGDPRLINPYSVITVRGARNSRDANLFADWLVSPAAAALIRDFGSDRFGQPLFFPAVDSSD
ncbi:MAG TPA: substrate-binding domain-containing protein [Longimicrobiales bacterium]